MYIQIQRILELIFYNKKSFKTALYENTNINDRFFKTIYKISIEIVKNRQLLEKVLKSDKVAYN